MIQEMSARHKPLVFKARSKVKDDCLSPSSLELYDLMYLETCVTAEAIWSADWTSCPVCRAEVTEDGHVTHLPRRLITQ